MALITSDLCDAMRSPSTKLAPNHLGFVVQVIVATLNNSLSMPGSIMPVPGPQ